MPEQPPALSPDQIETIELFAQLRAKTAGPWVDLTLPTKPDWYSGPSVFGMAPDTGLPGDPVVIRGTALQDATVSFGAIPAEVQRRSPGELRVVVPKDVTNGPVHVRFPLWNTTLSAPKEFTVKAASPTGRRAVETAS